MVGRNSSGGEAIFSIGNYALTIFFGWALYRYAIGSETRLRILLDVYVKFFYVIVIFSLLSLFFLLTLGELDLFGFKQPTKQHLVTPFGVHFKRVFGPITFYRSFFYFSEAVHVGGFYAANIIIVAPLLKAKAKAFKQINVLGGLLSLSVTFYIVLFVLYALKRIKSIYSFILILIFALCLLFLIQVVDAASYASGTDRIDRFFMFFLAMSQADNMQWLLGHGVASQIAFESLRRPGVWIAFNSGFTLSIYETGLIGTALQLLILFLFKPHFIIFVFFLLTAAVVDPIHYPFFWYFVIIISLAMNGETANSKSQYRN